jgi:hypothetical protein
VGEVVCWAFHACEPNTIEEKRKHLMRVGVHLKFTNIFILDGRNIVNFVLNSLYLDDIHPCKTLVTHCGLFYFLDYYQRWWSLFSYNTIIPKPLGTKVFSWGANFCHLASKRGLWFVHRILWRKRKAKVTIFRGKNVELAIFRP